MISSDIWHKCHEQYFKIYVISQADRRVKFDTILKISRVVFMPNITYKLCYYLSILLPAKGL